MKESEGTDTMKRIAGHVRKRSYGLFATTVPDRGDRVSRFVRTLCMDGLWPEITKPVGVVCILNGRFLFRFGGLHRDENGYLRFCKNG